MENPFKKAIKDNEKTKEIEDGVKNNMDVETDTDENSDAEVETVEAQSEENLQSDEPQENLEDENKVNDEKNPLQEKYETLNNQYIRLAADFDNYRKRNEQEREALLKYGAENTLKKMLEVLDNFERGLKAIETVDDCEKVKECYNLAYKNFTDVLSKAGLETIKAEGETFDPNFHEAVMQTPTNDKPENTIIAELQKGYKLGDKVLRPALVNVATEG